MQKGVYPYEYMDDWEKFGETLLLEIEDFYSHLNIENINDAGYVHAKNVCKDFEIKNLDICMFKVTHFCFKICVINNMNLILSNFFQLLD